MPLADELTIALPEPVQPTMSPDDPLVITPPSLAPSTRFPSPLESEMARVSNLREQARRHGIDVERSRLLGQATSLELPEEYALRQTIFDAMKKGPAEGPTLAEAMAERGPEDPLSLKTAVDKGEEERLRGLAISALHRLAGREASVQRNLSRMPIEELRDAVEPIVQKAAAHQALTGISISENLIRSWMNAATFGASEFEGALLGVTPMETFEHLMKSGQSAAAWSQLVGSVAGFATGGPIKLIKILNPKALRVSQTAKAWAMERMAHIPLDMATAALHDEELSPLLRGHILDTSATFALPYGFKAAGLGIKAGVMTAGQAGRLTASAAKATSHIVGKNAREFGVALEAAMASDAIYVPGVTFAAQAGGKGAGKGLSGDQARLVFGIAKGLGLAKEDLRRIAGVSSLREATPEQVSKLITTLNSMKGFGKALSAGQKQASDRFISAVDKAVERLGKAEGADAKAAVARDLNDEVARAALERISAGKAGDSLTKGVLEQRMRQQLSFGGSFAETVGETGVAEMENRVAAGMGAGGTGGGSGVSGGGTGGGGPTRPIQLPEPSNVPRRNRGHRLIDWLGSRASVGPAENRLIRLAGEDARPVKNLYDEQMHLADKMYQRRFLTAEPLFTDYTPDEMRLFRKMMQGKEAAPLDSDTSRIAKGFQMYRDLWRGTFEEIQAAGVKDINGNPIQMVDRWVPGNEPSRDHANAILFALSPTEFVARGTRTQSGRTVQKIIGRRTKARARGWVTRSAQDSPYTGQEESKLGRLVRQAHGGQTEDQMYRRYKEIEDFVASRFREERVRFQGGEIEPLPPGVEWKPTQEKQLRTQVVRYLQQHQSEIVNDSVSRPLKLTDEAFAPSQQVQSSVEFHRRFEWPDHVIEQDPHYLTAKALSSRTRKVADVMTFGQNNEKLVAAAAKARSGISARYPTRSDKLAEFDDVLGSIHANQVAAPFEDALARLYAERKGRGYSAARGILSLLYLGPGSKFLTIGNNLWGVVGAVATRPNTMMPALKAFGLLEPLGAAGAGALVGGALDTEDRVRGARTGAFIGGGLGLGANIARRGAGAAAIYGLPSAALAIGTKIAEDYGSDTPKFRWYEAMAVGLGSSLALSAALHRSSGLRTAMRASKTVQFGLRSGAARSMYEPLGSKSYQEQGIMFGRLPEMIEKSRIPNDFKFFLSDAVRGQELWNRSGAAVVGEEATGKWLSIIEKNPQKYGTAKGANGRYVRAVKELLRLDTTDDVMKIVRRGTGLTEAERERAGYWMAEVASGIGAPSKIPKWMHAEWSRMLAQFYIMSYRYTANQIGYVAEEMFHGNFRPLLKAVTVFTAAGIPMRSVGNWLNGSDLKPRDRDLLDNWLKSFGEFIGWAEIPLRAFTSRGETTIREMFIPATVEAGIDSVYSAIRTSQNFLSGVLASTGVGEPFGVEGDPEGYDKAYNRAIRMGRFSSLGRMIHTSKQRIAPDEQEQYDQAKARVNQEARDVRRSIVTTNPFYRDVLRILSKTGFFAKENEQALDDLMAAGRHFPAKTLEGMATEANRQSAEAAQVEATKRGAKIEQAERMARGEPALPPPSPPTTPEQVRLHLIAGALQQQRAEVIQDAIQHAQQGSTDRAWEKVFQAIVAFGPVDPKSIHQSFLAADRASTQKKDVPKIHGTFTLRRISQYTHTLLETPQDEAVGRIADLVREMPLSGQSAAFGTIIARRGRNEEVEGIYDYLATTGLNRRQVDALVNDALFVKAIDKRKR